MNFKFLILLFLFSCGVKNDPTPPKGSQFQSYDHSFTQTVKKEDAKKGEEKKSKNDMKKSQNQN